MVTQYDGSTAMNSGGHNGQGGGLWAYVSTELAGTVAGSSYFTDGFKLGMRPGDFLLGGYHSTAGTSVEVYLGIVTEVSSASGGATVRVGTLASSA
jgi:hypothetical protein